MRSNVHRYLLLLLGVVAAGLFSLWAGAMDITPVELLQIILSGDAHTPESAVVHRVRIPRSLVSFFVGAALGCSGVGFQAVLRNPLADPYILGVSGGAALGAVTAMSLGLTGDFATSLFGFTGALCALALVYCIGGSGRVSSHTLILSGVMVGSFASALLLFLLWTMPAEPTRAAVFWLAGDLSGSGSIPLGYAACWVGVGAAALWAMSRHLDLMTQGERVAADLGLSVGRTRLALFAVAGGLAAGAVSMAGLVGFVGLVVPHVGRIFFGPAHRRLLPACAVMGGLFLLVSDGLARTLFAPAELPVGVVTALLGAPFFLKLLRSEGRTR